MLFRGLLQGMLRQQFDRQVSHCVDCCPICWQKMLDGTLRLELIVEIAHEIRNEDRKSKRCLFKFRSLIYFSGVLCISNHSCCLQLRQRPFSTLLSTLAITTTVWPIMMPCRCNPNAVVASRRSGSNSSSIWDARKPAAVDVRFLNACFRAVTV